MSNEKLREAIKRLLKAHRITVQAPPKTITDAENQLREIENAVKYAEEALATTEPVMANGLTEAETDASASVVGLATTEPEPFDEREAFEREMIRRKSWTVYDFQPHPRRGEYPHPDYLTPHANTAWAGWQARAAMAKGVKG